MKKELIKSRTNRESKGLSDPLARTVLNSLSAHIAILDEQGVILETNQAWRKHAAKIRFKGVTIPSV